MPDYKLVRSWRRTLSVEVKNGGVTVRAPVFLGRGNIERFVNSKSDWIEGKLKDSKPNKTRIYNENEQFLFFGKSYQLKIVQGSKNIRLSDNQLIVSTQETDPKYLRKIIENFYLKLTSEAVGKILLKYKDRFKAGGFKTVFRFYRSKWGSCSRENLCFNARLAMAPLDVIEYVVIHELAHLNIKNHSKEFWQEVAKFDVQYKIHRNWLSKNNEHFEL